MDAMMGSAAARVLRGGLVSLVRDLMARVSWFTSDQGRLTVDERDPASHRCELDSGTRRPTEDFGCLPLRKPRSDGNARFVSRAVNVHDR
jgi:hypothetical protein